ncbi:MAG TPA: DUF3160 domain-containing protein [Candidatus Ozemobacteraceae bacterium]|nr:DUF3160 domain-containing protein [Candidatus Ozemobacteraceae bacterium]
MITRKSGQRGFALSVVLLALVTVFVTVHPPVLTAAELILESDTPFLDPSFSPDGTKIVCIGEDQGQPQVVLFDRVAGKVRILTSSKGEKRTPCFAGDEKTIFFCGKEKGNFDIFKVGIEGGKEVNLTRTPENEFACEVSVNVFEDEDEKRFYRVYYLKGKDKSGALWSITDNGKNPREEIAGAFQAFTLHSDLRSIVLSDGKALLSALYLVSSTGEGIITVDAPAKPVAVPGSAGLKEPVFTGNDLHLAVRRAKSAVLLDPSTATTQSLTTQPWISRPAFSRARPEMALIIKNGNRYRLDLVPLTQPELRIRNLYKFPGNRFFTLNDSDAAWNKIKAQSFVVIPDKIREFFMLYESNRYEWLDSYITIDAAFHLFHLFYDYTLKEIERGTFRAGIASCSAALAHEAALAVEAATNPQAKSCLQTLQGVFTLAALLYEPDPAALQTAATKVPAAIRESLTHDLEKILNANENCRSKLLGRPVDFTQFKVRGHYEGEPALESYFRTVMLFGQFGLRVASPDGTAPSEDLPLILALAWLGQKAKVQGKPVSEVLADLSAPIDFLVGEPEDLPFPTLAKTMGEQQLPTNADDCVDPQRLKAVFETLKQYPRPRIRPQDGVQVFVFPQRATLDSIIMQQLVYRAVGTQAKPRWLPRLLDVMAGLGSARAKALLLDTLHEGQYDRYESQLEKATREVAGLKESTWTDNLYRGWLGAFRDLCLNTDQPTMAFAQSPAWTDRILYAALGSLTTLRHDTLLYNKMGGAEAGEGGERMYRKFPRVFVDPYPSVYARMRRLTLELYGLMKARGFLPPEDKKDDTEETDMILGASLNGLMKSLAGILEKLEAAARKQARGEVLSEAEQAALFEIGRDLEHLTIALTAKPEDGFGNIYNDECSLIADVFTGDETVRECAVGRVFNLFVRHAANTGFEYLYRGGTYSFYEFEQPLSNRLSDKQWKKMIRDNQLPPLPEWSRSFIVGDPPKIDPDEEYYPGMEENQ